jgi:hypothetical protein
MKAYRTSRSLKFELTIATAVVLALVPFAYWGLLVWRLFND